MGPQNLGRKTKEIFLEGGKSQRVWESEGESRGGGDERERKREKERETGSGGETDSTAIIKT